MKGILVVALLLSCSLVSLSARYNGKSIDGVWYSATLRGGGEIKAVKVAFDGLSVTVNDGKRSRSLKLESETIADPNAIIAFDELGTWTIHLDDKIE